MIKENPDRHAGIVLNRTSKYPIEIMDKRGHSIYLNPLKRMIKNKPYRNEEYLAETNRMMREAIQRNQAIEKQRQEEQNKIASGKVTYEVKNDNNAN